MTKKTFSVLIFSAAVAFLIIGIHQVMTVGWAQGYWVFMITVALLLWYKIRTKETDSKKPVDKNTGKNKKGRK